MDAIIRQIVDRCHVADSNLAVVRYFLSRMKPGAFWKLSKRKRRNMLAAVLKRHAENRAVYRLVMRGGFL